MVQDVSKYATAGHSSPQNVRAGEVKRWWSDVKELFLCIVQLSSSLALHKSDANNVIKLHFLSQKTSDPFRADWMSVCSFCLNSEKTGKWRSL